MRLSAAANRSAAKRTLIVEDERRLAVELVNLGFKVRDLKDGAGVSRLKKPI
jgi:hypothetical protein